MDQPLMTSNSHYFIDLFQTPLGLIWIMATDRALMRLVFDDGLLQDGTQALESHQRSNAVTEKTKQQLFQYFQAERTRFDLPLKPIGTPFQQSVWNALLSIGFGETISYSEQARCIGRPESHRAVANANGRNPIPIIIPCHRVIAKDGGLGGYGPGKDKKQWLLQHESEF